MHLVVRVYESEPSEFKYISHEWQCHSVEIFTKVKYIFLSSKEKIQDYPISLSNNYSGYVSPYG
jgi:hypothetical protein